MKPIPSNQITDRLTDMTNEFFDRHKVEVKPNGVVMTAGKEIPIADLERRFAIDTLHHVAAGITKESKALFFEERINTMKRAAYSKVVGAIAYDPSKLQQGQTALRSWLAATMGSEPTELDIAVMNHTLWQMCRKANGLTTEYQIMPIFISRDQGIGKSENIKRLLKPIESLTIFGQSVDYVTDKNNYPELGENLCIFLDEMARSNQADIQKLKAIITGDNLAYRRFFKQSNGYTKQQCTFIGTSNREFREMIQDTTGARRFYTYACKASPTRDELQARFNIINSLDIMSIWQSINEHQDVRYTKPFDAELAEAQEKLRLPSSVEEWLEETGLAPGSVSVPLADLYHMYKTDAANSGRREVYNKRNFKLLLFEKGFATTAYGNGAVLILCNKRTNADVIIDKRILKGV